MKNTFKIILLLFFIFKFSSDTLAQKTYEFTVYDDKGFGGESKTYYINGSIGDFKEGKFSDDNWGERISSVKVGKGLKLIMFDNRFSDLRGTKWTAMYEGGCDNLRSWNDRAKSYKLEIIDESTPLVSLYDRAEREGTYQKLGPGKYNFDQLIYNDAISGVEIPKELVLILYDDANFNNEGITMDGNRYEGFTNLNGQFSDRTSSVEIKEKKYGLKSVRYLGNPKEISRKNGAAGGTAYLDNLNNTDVAEASKTVSYTHSSEVTTSWSNSIEAGFSISQEVAVEGTVGLATVTSTTTATASLTNTFTFGKDKSKTNAVEITDNITVTASPGTKKEINLIVTKVIYDYTVEFTYGLIDKIDGNGNPIFVEGIERKVREIVRLTKATKAVATIIDITPKSKVSAPKVLNTLKVGQVLKSGQKIVSLNGVYYLKMQEDGNLCLKKTIGDVFVWCMTGDTRKIKKGAVCTMQSDGNLNLSFNGKWVWSAFGETSQLTKGSYLKLTNGGKIQIIAPNGTIKWEKP
jgi:hypothetical protein